MLRPRQRHETDRANKTLLPLGVCRLSSKTLLLCWHPGRLESIETNRPTGQPDVILCYHNNTLINVHYVHKLRNPPPQRVTDHSSRCTKPAYTGSGEGHPHIQSFISVYSKYIYMSNFFGSCHSYKVILPYLLSLSLPLSSFFRLSSMVSDSP